MLRRCLRLERGRRGARKLAISGQRSSMSRRARSAVPGYARVLLTSATVASIPSLQEAIFSGVVRVIEPVSRFCPPAWRLLQKRPPYLARWKSADFPSRRTDYHSCYKNSGGEATAAKLIAARKERFPS